jgi:hypothetical protein
MNNNNILDLMLFVIFVSICLVAFFAMLDIFFPVRVGKVEHLVQVSPGRSFLIGVVNLIFFGAVVGVLIALTRNGQYSPIQVLGIVILFVLAVVAIFGLAGVARMIGERLAPQSHGVLRVAWGAIPLTLACAVPFIGWFGFFPFVLLMGFGAFVLSLFRGEKTAEPPVLPVVPQPPVA